MEIVSMVGAECSECKRKNTYIIFEWSNDDDDKMVQNKMKQSKIKTNTDRVKCLTEKSTASSNANNDNINSDSADDDDDGGKKISSSSSSY